MSFIQQLCTEDLLYGGVSAKICNGKPDRQGSPHGLLLNASRCYYSLHFPGDVLDSWVMMVNNTMLYI